jgi:voltage-gated potassium channel
MSIIDLLAIHPELRPIRLLKLFRYFENTGYLVSVFRDKKYEITLLSMIVLMALAISSAMFYQYEYANDKIHSYFDAFYWAVITMGTVGYGDITPDTYTGKVISIILVFVGLSILAMFTSIITTGLEKKINESKERDSYKSIDRLDSYVVIVGYGKIAADVAQKLKDFNEHFIILDTNREKVERAKSHGFLAFLFDGTHTATYHSLKIHKKIKAVLAMTTSDLTNLSIILGVRSLSKNVFIVVKANNVDNKDKFLLAHANEVVSEKMGAKMLSQFVNAPVAFEAMSSLAHGDRKIVVEEITIGAIENKNAYIAASTIEIDSFAVILIGVFKNTNQVNEIFDFNPAVETLRLHTHDVLVVAGRPKNIEGLRLKIMKESIG